MTPLLTALTISNLLSPPLWRGVTVHHSAGPDDQTANSIRRYHVDIRGWSDIGYHFLIHMDGRVESTGRWHRQEAGAHCKGHNQTIGICLIGNFERHRPQNAQQEALVRLCRDLCVRYAWEAGTVVLHRDRANATTKCPGQQFDGGFRP